jgi:hypothetical protein
VRGTGLDELILVALGPSLSLEVVFFSFAFGIGFFSLCFVLPDPGFGLYDDDVDEEELEDDDELESLRRERRFEESSFSCLDGSLIFVVVSRFMCLDEGWYELA